MNQHVQPQIDAIRDQLRGIQNQLDALTDSIDVGDLSTMDERAWGHVKDYLGPAWIGVAKAIDALKSAEGQMP
jgi:hypothetical protein